MVSSSSLIYHSFSMELRRERSLAENRKNMILPKRLSFSNHDDSESNTPRTSCASTTTPPPLQIWPTSPEISWTRSSLDTTTTHQSSSSLVFQCLASLHHSQGKILSIAASKHYVFTGSENRRIHAWKLPDCIEMGCVKANAGQVRALLAIDKLLFTSHGDYKVRVWDVPQMETFRARKIATLPKRSFIRYPRMKTHTDNVSCISYNHLEKLLYTGSWDKTIKVWKISDKQCVDSFIAHEGHVNAIVINQDNGCVFTASSDGTIKIWRRIFQTSSHILTITLKFEQSPVNALALNKDILYSGSSDGLVNFWEKEITSGRYNHGGFLQGHQFGVLCLVSIEDLILSGSEDSTIRVWKRDEGCLHSCLAIIDGHNGPVKCLAVTLENQDVKIGLLVYSASFDQTFKVWRIMVYPGQKKTNLMKFETEGTKQEVDIDASGISPVLSPSWVERRIQW